MRKLMKKKRAPKVKGPPYSAFLSCLWSKSQARRPLVKNMSFNCKDAELFFIVVHILSKGLDVERKMLTMSFQFTQFVTEALLIGLYTVTVGLAHKPSKLLSFSFCVLYLTPLQYVRTHQPFFRRQVKFLWTLRTWLKLCIIIKCAQCRILVFQKEQRT